MCAGEGGGGRVVVATRPLCLSKEIPRYRLKSRVLRSEAENREQLEDLLNQKTTLTFI